MDLYRAVTAAEIADVVAFLAPDAPDARARLAAAGVPAFQSPETCADVVAAALGRCAALAAADGPAAVLAT